MKINLLIFHNVSITYQIDVLSFNIHFAMQKYIKNIDESFTIKVNIRDQVLFLPRD